MGSLLGAGLYILLIIFFLGTIKTRGCFEGERLALLKFRDSITDYFEVLSSWVGRDCCQWERVRCSNATGHVVSLDLRGTALSFPDEYYLTGNLDSALVDLKHLEYLDLSGNEFQFRPIPEFIGSLKQLRYLNVSNARFGGEVPSQIGNLSNLHVLDLSCGDCFTITGLQAHDVEGFTRLSLLRHLDMRGVDLSEARNIDKVLTTIPSLVELSLSNCALSSFHLPLRLNSSSALSTIQFLDLSDNSLVDKSISFLRNMTSLVFLDLSSHDLSQSQSFRNLLNVIPSLSELHLSNCRLVNTHLYHAHLNFSALLDIRHLDLSHNLFKGKFPSFLANMTSLRSLDLSSNRLNSSIPSMKSLVELRLRDNNFHHLEDIQIWSRCHLKLLSLSKNNFQGEMIGPSTNVSECANYDLEKLYLSSNQFTGSIPASLGRLSSLRELYLPSNRLTGSIPVSLGQLTKLKELVMDSNQLVGPIPTFLGNLTALEVLDLGSNQLTGAIPDSLGRMISLKELSLASNLLTGTIPISFGQLTKLRILDVSNNFLEGSVFEDHFAKLSLLKCMIATSNNMLTFNISPEWIPPFQLRNIQLSSCKVAGEFPQWIQTQRKLVVLQISNASISGPLPIWLRDMPIIASLDLSHNIMSGPLTNLPSNNGPGIDYLGALLLRNNHFDGEIPKSVCKRPALQYLDISKNRLSGKLPQCLENLEMLRVLMVSSNRLSAVIPSSLGHLPLRWLDLSNNSFQGELPVALGNCKDLQVLDVGENELFGNIPKWIGENIEGLAVLRLHKNNFTGRIPLELCKGWSLQILDLAHNNLVGTIPHCVGELDWMVNGSQGSQSFIDLDISYGIFEENVMQVMKGVQLEYTKNMRLVANMDLSSNKLVGEIPEELTALSGLIGLNLSHNHLSGGIPDKIGDMKALISLDVSVNNLSGTIPTSIAALNFLSYLNLSYNNLSGQIPSGNQLQTLTDPSIYAGNRELCGAPLPKLCSNDEDQTRTSGKEKDEAGNEAKKVWLYLDIMSGFATGFWGVIGVLLLKRRCRHALFQFVEAMVDKIHTIIAVSLSKLMQKLCIVAGVNK